MNDYKTTNKNCGIELKNGYIRTVAISPLGRLALTALAYDGDMRIPCVVIEECGQVQRLSFDARYAFRFACRGVVKSLKYRMFPRRIDLSEAILDALIS